MRAAFHTLGCKTNSYETQAVKEQFEKAGFEIAEFSERADVYVINTCSVTAVAAQKSRQMLHRAKKMNPDAVVVACGCYAQEAADKLAESGVDLVIGNNEKTKTVELVRKYLENNLNSAENSTEEAKAGETAKSLENIYLQDLMHCTDYEEQTITNAGDHVRAYVKIQDGCNRFCSYCIIPYLRGRSRSRKMEEILNEVKTLAERGIREIVLTGIDISDFKRTGEELPGTGKATPGKTAPDHLAELIFEIEKIEGIDRIRLGSLEAGIITEAFLKQIRNSKKLCPHFHLSLQSGCDTTLKRMNRDYTAAEFTESLKMIRDCFAHPAITTDVIAGFAGETEEEFEETKRFVKEAAFSEMHVFPYSRRKGTRADKMPGQLNKAEKAKRAGELITIGKEMQLAFMDRFIGQEICILTEEAVSIEGKEYLLGFTPEYVKAAIAKEKSEINKIVTLSPKQIIEFQNEPLLAE